MIASAGQAALQSRSRRTATDGWVRARRRPSGAIIALAFLCLGALLVALVFATPFNHDEDQYLAAADLAQGARLYRDFLYVQTPFYPELASVVSRLAPGWSFLVLRLFSAGCGLATGLGVWSALRRLGVRRRHAGVAVLLMASVYTFQYVSSVVRNDALPMALLAWAIALAAGAMRPAAKRTWLGWGGGGLLLGFSVSAKVSFAPLLAIAGVFLLLQLSRRPGRSAMADLGALAVGASLGLSPIVLAWAQAPEAVRFGLVDFWAVGPRRWYVANGLAWRMAPGAKLLYGLGDLALGPALAALVAVGVDRLRGPPDEDGSRAAGLLDLMILAGLAAAFAPSPTYKPYFAPLLAPLFVRLGTILEAGRTGAGTRGVLALGAATGGVLFILTLAHPPHSKAADGRWAPLDVARQAHWIGGVLHRAGARGAVATLSPHTVLDSGFPLDPRFAGGAMVYRSADGMDPRLRARLHVTAPSSLAADLDAAPPAAIVTGYEGAGGDTRIDLDAGLRAYALRRGYDARRSPWGPVALYIRPTGDQHVAR